MAEIITTEQALEIISKSVSPIGAEQIGYINSLNRVLAEPVFSDMNFPPFNKSAMDGYACRKIDLDQPLTIIEEIPAGKVPFSSIKPGQCAKIMTGAEVPEGADIVIMKEYVKVHENHRIEFTGKSGGSNICFLGEDVKSGDRILERGTLIKPDHLALLAGVGQTEALVYKKPSIGIISTGSEIVEPQIIPSRGQIRNSNGYQLFGQVLSIGLNADYLGIVKDVKDSILNKILTGINDHDLIVISGGVSVGDYDFIPEILKELDFELLITHIASKPGKHTILAKQGNKYVLGLPGNPVSSFIQFEVIGKALIYNMMGFDFKPLRLSVKLSGDFKRKNADRFEIVPVKITAQGEAERLPYHGSAHIQALAYADALMEIPLGTTQINKGEMVYVRPL